MSVHPANTDLSFGQGSESQPSATYAPGREALQALLAFSSLHQQIRQRQKLNGGRSTPAEDWKSERFVRDEALQLVSERAMAVTGADGVTIALAEDGAILCRASSGRIAPDIGSVLDANSGFSGACYQSGLVVRCDDTEFDPRVDALMCRRLGVRSMVAVPLTANGVVIGLLEAFSSDAYGFNDSDVRSLSLLAELILAALKPEEEVPPPAPEPRVETAPETERSQSAISRALVLAAEERRAREAAQEAASMATPEALPEAVSEAANEPVQEIAHATEIPEAAEFPPPEPHFEDRDFTPQALPRLVPDEAETVKPEPMSANPPAFMHYGEKPEKKRGLLLPFLFLLLLAGAAFAAWWWMTHRPSTEISPPQAAQPVTAQPAQKSDSSAPGNENDNPPAAEEKDDTNRPQVTGIRHWSSTDSSTVAIDLQDQVQYEAHRLTEPERIYFDLHDTSLGPGVPKDTEVGDALLVRIRVAQPTPGITRVVLETKQSPNFSVSLEPNPYRLVVEVRSINAKPQAHKRINLFGPATPNLDEYASNSYPDGKSKSKSKQARPLPGGANATTAESLPPAGVPKFRIVLDAGHGGWDMGTVGRRGLLEKDLVLDIVGRLGSLIQSRLGAEVIYTRRDDTYISLERRTAIANLAQADMFLSVHANYSDYASARGVETYFANTFAMPRRTATDPDDLQLTDINLTSPDIREKAEESKRFAADVQKSLYRSLAAENPSLRNRGVKRASYVVLTGTAMPAVLAEVSFVSSPSDENSLRSSSYRQRIAEALYKGVITYATGMHHVNLASAAAGPSGQ